MQLEIIPYFRIFHFQASSVLHMVFWKCVGVCAEGGGGGGVRIIRKYRQAKLKKSNKHI